MWSLTSKQEGMDELGPMLLSLFLGQLQQQVLGSRRAPLFCVAVAVGDDSEQTYG
jgi:hypothetical protein